MRRSVSAAWSMSLLGILMTSSPVVNAQGAEVPPGPPYPEPTEGVAVYDYAELLSDEAVGDTEATIAAIKDRTGAEVVVYTQVKPASDTAEETEADAAALVEQWGVGRWGASDGLVMLFDVDETRCHGQLQLYAAPGFDTAYMSQSDRQATFEAMLPALQECDMDAALAVAMAHVDAATTFESTPVEELFPTSIDIEGFSVIEPGILRGERDISDYLLGPDPAPGDLVPLLEMAWTTGHTLDDMTQVWGGFRSADGDLQFELTGWQLPGVDTMTFLDAARDWAAGRMDDPATEEVEIAGRMVTVMDTVETLGTPNYMYAYDDVVWLFAAPREYAGAIVETLPGVTRTASGGSASASSFGGRVEMAESGFALTLPDGWVAFDIGGDLEAQVEAVVQAIGTGWEPDAAGLLERLQGVEGEYDLVAMELSSIVSGDPESTQVCNVGLASGLEGATLDELVPAVVTAFESMEGIEILHGPEALELPSGPAYLLGISQPGPEDLNAPVSAALYFVARDDEYRVIDCVGPTGPTDDWSAIIETWEWLDDTTGGDAADGAGTDGADAQPRTVVTGGRIEVSQQGYALTAPDDWVSVIPTPEDADSILETLREIDPDLAATAGAALAGQTDFSLLTFGSFDAQAGFRENCNVIDYPSGGVPLAQMLKMDAAALEELDNLASGPRSTSLELPAGEVGRLDYGLRYPGLETAHTAYYFTDESDVHLMTCTGVVRPEDDWLSIAETWEWLGDE